MESLTFNPRATLTLMRHGGAVVSVDATAPVRGRGLRRARFARDRDPGIVDLLERVARREGAVEALLDPTEWSRLADAGLLVPARETPGEVRFRCDLPEGESDAPPAGDLLADPSLIFRDTPDPPAPTAFADSPAWAEVTPPGEILSCFFSLKEAERPLLRSLVPGAPLPADLAPAARASLLAAGIASAPAAAERRRGSRAAAIATAAAELTRARHTVVRDMVPAALLPALQRYYRDLVAEGWVAFGDGQVSARYAAHSEPLACALHARLAGLASALAGAPMVPSYPYFITYLGGAVLDPHRDRPQCELSISLLVDESPEPDGPSPWALHLETPEGDAAIHLRIGDGAAFYGRELTHWRHALPEGRRSTTLLLHFVPEGFDGPLR